MPCHSIPGQFKRSALMLAFITASSGAWAEEANLNLDYTCVFPILEEQPLSVAISATIPTSASVGENLEAFQISADATVGEASWNGLSFVGTQTLEGRVVASSNIKGNGIDLDLEIPLAIEPTTLPDEKAAFDVNASGKTIPIEFVEANVGDVNITVGGVVMSLEPKDQNGNLTGLGSFQSECTLNDGQSKLLRTIVVKDDQEETTEFVASGQGELTFASLGTIAPLSANLDINGSDALANSTLSLSDTSADFKIISLFNTFSLDTDIEFDSNTGLTGTVSEDEIDLQARMHLSLPRAQMKLFGLTLANGGGSECRTTEPATFRASSSAGGWSQTGGSFTLSGTLDIPEFEGCGNVNNLINRHIAGTEQAVELNMTTTSINGQ